MEKIINKLPIENITKVAAVSGGDVNDSYKVYTEDINYFLKVQKNNDKSFFDGEKAGLILFNENNIKAPKFICSGDIDGDAYLLMTYHEEKSLGEQKKLGNLVAKIHRIESPNKMFGFDFPYRGAGCTFSNSYKKTWKEVFLYERMDKLKDELENSGLWNEKDLERYKLVRDIIEKELDNHKSRPSLLHGDLWSGNFMFDEDYEPMVFDPSPLYGDREFDIGISTVFSGFRKDFYDAYQSSYKLDEGFQKRLDFYRLYLLMVHLLKFGRVYDGAVSDFLKKIIG